MKQRIVLIVVLLAGLGSLLVVERRHERSQASANALVNMAADAQRDVLRAPMQMTHLSDDEEERIGDEMAERYLSATGEGSGSQFSRKVQQVGGKLAAHAHRKINYRFHLVEDRQLLNAFALPGGHVFIGLGLLQIMDTEDELAAVLGHEIEHVDHYHCAERVQVEARLRKLQLGELSTLAQIPLAIFQAGYSKDQEAEADREGLLLAAESGYSPNGALSIFEKFDRLYVSYVDRAGSPPEELSQLAVETLAGYFRSHPLPEERIAQAKRVIAEHHLALPRETPL